VELLPQQVHAHVELSPGHGLPPTV
jgi:hypothetical protein